MNSYRVDKVAAIPAGQDYVVPCGMNSIVKLSDSAFNVFALIKNLPKITATEVYLYSKWDKITNDYTVLAILKHNSTDIKASMHKEGN